MQSKYKRLFRENAELKEQILIIQAQQERTLALVTELLAEVKFANKDKTK